VGMGDGGLTWQAGRQLGSRAFTAAARVTSSAFSSIKFFLLHTVSLLMTCHLPLWSNFTFR
jgi:hypothetical protein